MKLILFKHPYLQKTFLLAQKKNGAMIFVEKGPIRSIMKSDKATH